MSAPGLETQTTLHEMELESALPGKLMMGKEQSKHQHILGLNYASAKVKVS